MFTRIVHFEVVKRSQIVPYKCTRCSKKRTKIVKTEHTINPFNKNAAGSPKSREEVLVDVRAHQIKKVAEVTAGVMCNKCKDEVVAERDAARKAERNGTL